jgi:DNA replicative helicase MCM subunit Mcm2 (Cdc46/Mcm family)
MQDKLRVILSEIVELSKDTGMVEKKLLVDEIAEKHKIAVPDIQRLIGRMIKDGTIYEPRPGFLKKV